MRNEGIILFLGDFNVRIATNQDIILSNHSNPDPLWLDEDDVIATRLKRTSEDKTENLFGTELLKLCSSHDLIICNGISKWPSFGQMTYLHGLGSSVVDYVISKIHVLSHITNFELLNDFELDSDHRPLSLTLNLVMNTSHM